ncbi:MAG: hypothetical protein LBC63_08025 [Holophagales bacterium]|nr:hypothetical protein [Holophagales bacterium]
MPIYSPALPPSPHFSKDKSPIPALVRFDLGRIWRNKIGRFFGLVFIGILAVQLTVIYTKYLLDASVLEQAKGIAGHILPKPAALQASLLHGAMLFFLWFQSAWINGALVSRDTLYRVRPLIYAHPVRPAEYLAAKAIIAIGMPFCFQLPFIFLPWLLSLLLAGAGGPIWATAPLHLVPAAALNSMVIASVTLGASSLAGTPKTGMAWALGLIFGLGAVGGILFAILHDPNWMAINPAALTESWPKLLCGADNASVPLTPSIIATAVNICLWAYVSWQRTRPSEAVI